MEKEFRDSHTDRSIDNFLNIKILNIGRIILIIAFLGYLTYSLAELFWGQFPTFVIGIITSFALIFPVTI